MSLNLVDLLKGALANEQVMGAASSFLGEDSKNTSNAISQAIPALLGGLASKAATTEGASSLLNMLTQGNHNGNILSDVAGIFGGGDSTNALMRSGSSLLGNIFGDKMTGVIDLISSVSGIKRESSANLMSLAAPVAMGLLGKIKGEQNLGASGLANLMGSQSGILQAAAPAGLAALLGIGSFDKLGLGSVASAATSTIGSAASSVNAQVGEAKSGIGKWLPWLLLGLLALGGFWFMKNCKGNKTEAGMAVDSLATANLNNVDSMVTNTATAMVDSAKANVSDAMSALGAFFKKKLSTGVELNIPENGIENKLIGFIEDKDKAVDKTTWFNFDRINFATGKASLTAESAEQVKNIAEILKAYPSVSLKLGGYTDNTGNKTANLSLSTARANTIVSELTKLGVDAKRLAGEGYGDQFPVADNGTAEGRAQNRRIAVRVTAK